MATSAAQGPVQQPTARRKSQDIFTEIAFAACVLTIPLLVLTGVLLGLIFKNLIQTNSSTSNAFGLGSGNVFNTDAYYVDFSATQLTTVASWCSSVAPLLPGAVMALLFFHIASTLRNETTSRSTTDLPTPQQLSLLIGFSEGGLGSLWRWLQYMFRRQRETSVHSIRLSAGVLLSAMFLGYLIWAADTWLHVVTSTQQIFQVSPVSVPSSRFGRFLPLNCSIVSDVTGTSTTILDACNLVKPASGPQLIGGADASNVLSNQSARNQIITQSLGKNRYSLIADKSISPVLDFQATTFGAEVDCVPTTKACQVEAKSGASTSFECSEIYKGDLSLGIVPTCTSCSNRTGPRLYTNDFFYDENFQRGISMYNVSANPFYMAIGGILNLFGSLDGIDDNLRADPEVVVPVHGGIALFLRCKVSMYDMLYTYQNGTVQSAKTSLVNDSDSNTFMAPFLTTNFADVFLESAFKTAAISNTSQEVADKFAVSLGRIVLASTVGVMEPSRNLAEQTRQPKLVTRMPKAPLLMLVVANLLYVLFGLMLLVFVCISDPKGSADVRKRLTIEGLATTAFEPHDTRSSEKEELYDNFAESKGHGKSSRIGFLHSEQTGWQYASLAGSPQAQQAPAVAEHSPPEVQQMLYNEPWTDQTQQHQQQHQIYEHQHHGSYQHDSTSSHRPTW